MKKITEPQFRLLLATFKLKSGAHAVTMSTSTGRLRTLNKLRDLNLVEYAWPYEITPQGLAALHQAAKIRWMRGKTEKEWATYIETEIALLPDKRTHNPGA